MMNPKLILSPIDFSDPSAGALDVASDVATRYGAEILLFHAVPVIPRLPQRVSIFAEGDYEKELIKSAEDRLNEIVTKLAQKGIKARAAVGLANDAAMEIVRTADHEKADLIVIATHGMTGWRRLPFGSVADKVVRTAECPVLVLRSAASGAAAKGEEHSSATAR
jgi:nucleotide-binding universal stress UspA family protein